MDNEFGVRLKLLRDGSEIPMSKLAEAIGSTKAGISRYENGKMEPGITVVRKLAEYFGVTMDWLAGNGDINDIQYANKKPYMDAVNKSIKEGITPEKLSQFIDIMRK